MIARINNFKIGLCRGKEVGPVRTVELSVQSESHPALQHVYIHFFEDKIPKLGYVNEGHRSIIACWPTSDFDLALILLHDDLDVFFAWTADSSSDLVWSELTTSDQPTKAQEHHKEIR